MKRLVGRILGMAATTVPERTAVTLGTEARTFMQVERAANRLAHVLIGRGVRPGDRVMTWCSISIEDPALYFAILRCGATYVPMNPAYSDQEAENAIGYIEPHLLIADVDHMERAQSIFARCVLLDGGERAESLLREAATASETLPDVGNIDEEAIESIFLTSGSTGTPKGVMVSHRATWNRMLGRSRNDLCGAAGEVSMFPMFHFAGWAMLLSSWAYRRPLHMVRSASAEEILGAAERWRAGVLYAIPSIWERLLAAQSRYDLKCVRYALTGTSRVEPELMQRIGTAFPEVRLGVLYGSTEMGGALAIYEEDVWRKPLSVGMPYPGFEAKISDGELLLRSDTVMSGYFRLPETTAAVMDGDWYRSGDLAERDAEGFYTITGRRSEVIRSGGEYIAPAEVEAALRDAPGVGDVAVLGLPDSAWGEIICAAVVPAGDCAPPDVAALRAHLATRLASFKHPRRVELVTSLPRTQATGQVQRSAIRKIIISRSTADG